MTTKCSTLILVAIAVLAVLLPACGAKGDPITVPAGARAGNLVGLEPCTYEANKVEYDADCGTLVVPAIRALIRLVRRLRRGSERAPSARGARAAAWIVVGISLLNLLFVVGTALWGNPFPCSASRRSTASCWRCRCWLPR